MSSVSSGGSAAGKQVLKCWCDSSLSVVNAHVHSRAAHWATAGACRSKGSENLQMQFCMAISVDYTVYNFQVRTLAAREHDTTCRELC